MIDKSIKKLVTYGMESGLLKKDDSVYATNLILDLCKKTDYKEPEEEFQNVNLEETLKEILDYAFQNNIITDNTTVSRDLFDTRIMNCLMPRPSEVIDTFYKKYEKSKKEATDYFYKLSQDSDYIRRYRIVKDQKWITKTPYGKLDITINLSKPEKDPKAIAAAKNAVQSDYPKCLLCMENVGYAGHLNHPARQNHRVIPISILGTEWGFQYSPYVYYNEHCIVFNGKHTPMKIDRSAFEKLFDFINLFPHYSIGSNADLPIVGGSILSHDHFQGGNYEFPMARAEYVKTFQIPNFEDVTCGIIFWPISVLRIRGKDSERLIDLATHILETWRSYTDEDAFIFSETDGEAHNTITPIARKRGDFFEMDLALRNNITTDEYPLGVYHPHRELHHIKKENIGLIEVMGLAILPSRLKEEMELLKDYILNHKNIRSNKEIEKHGDWVDEFLKKYSVVDEKNIDTILQDEIGMIFMQVLEQAGVYKNNQKGLKNFEKFVSFL
ncbi:MAG: UDP-glucose--hexose-1-phosphate uridylyltransferase [Lachnospiraceae bacterium]|nr:UDP-glucose--hexose-1-phosphate uridylyltransferase [Lachnospiraceae bacterium]